MRWATVLIGSFLFAGTPGALAEEGPTADRIQALIAQLGGVDFQLRESAMQSLIAMGSPIVPALDNAKRDNKDPELVARIHTILTQVDPLYLLVEVYKAYGLPVPPKEATLVRFAGDKFKDPEDQKEKRRQHLALWCVAGNDQKVLMAGTKIFQPDEYPGGPPDALKPLPEVATGTSEFYTEDPFHMGTQLPLAIQSRMLGWDSLSNKLLDQVLNSPKEDRPDDRYKRAKRLLMAAAWDHWQNELLRPESDRREILKFMRRLHDSNPDFGVSYLGSVIVSLEATVNAQKANPATVEALIGDLTEIPYRRGKYDRDSRITKLLHKGFEAVPALIEHVNDIRLTRTITPGINKMPTHHCTVAEIVQDIFRDLDDGKGEGNDLWAKEVRLWWQRAQDAGEEAYLLRYVVPQDPKKEWPNATVLAMLAGRYPKHLPTVYRNILSKRPGMQSYPVADAINRR